VKTLGCHVCHWLSCSTLILQPTPQAYRHWKKSSHEYLFMSNNDVLVPNGALTSLMRVMREDGEACQLPLRLHSTACRVLLCVMSAANDCLRCMKCSIAC